MKEHPILFSAPMIRAILDGRKTQTRRVGDMRGADRVYWHVGETHRWGEKPPQHYEGWVAEVDKLNGLLLPLHCPFGQPGDRLWCKHSADLFPVYYKPIPNWEGLYAAGTDGVIYRTDRGEPQPLKPAPSGGKGYPCVSLSRNGEWTTMSVHGIVCRTFYGPKPFEGAQVRHMDGSENNSRPENLDWGTQEDNWQDRKAHGGGMGESHHAAKLTAAQVAEIRSSLLSQRQLAARFGVSQSTIQGARSGETWGEHEPAPRNFPAFKLWKPSIHMPRWASRITLEVTGVRVERVQEIKPEDAAAEAADDIILNPKHPLRTAAYERGRTIRGERFAGIVEGYAALWDSLNEKRGYGWDVNPFVWCISFKRLSESVEAAA